ncbi:MAG: flagellar brake protein [Oscillospiraceae bacterium]|jgi:c-di-GMP-binding flagellar brake protein YcgR|nr:flagellar brake protein [Oscillospiraceae bacterium]
MNLKLGERLEVESEGKSYVSQLYEITPLGTLKIAVPIVHREILVMRVDEKFNISYYRPQGRFSFVALVRHVDINPKLTIIEVEIQGKIQKHQRREFVRMDTKLVASVRLLAGSEEVRTMQAKNALFMSYNKPTPKDGEKEESGKEPSAECITIDISGGGLHLMSPVLFEVGSLVESTLVLHTGETITNQAKVLRCLPGDQKDRPFKLGLQFANVDENTRRKLVKYIFERQLAERKVIG